MVNLKEVYDKMKFTEYIKDSFSIEIDKLPLYREAFTHSSYVNEHRNEKLQDNERLEFLGDAVLEIAVSNYLFHKYPAYPEGVLTRMRSDIVREESLYMFSTEIGFDQYVRLGNGEERNGGRNRPSLLADLFEAFLGALYLDLGIDMVGKFLAQVVFPKIDAGVFSHGMDFKTALQEYLQQGGEIGIDYELVSEDGPAHNRQFSVEVSVESIVLGRGSGRTKKEAEQNAAKAALEQVKEP